MIPEEYSETYFKGYKDGWDSAVLVLKNLVARGDSVTIPDLIKNMEETPEDLLRSSADAFSKSVK